MIHLKKTLCLLLAVMMLLALGVPAMAAGEIPVDAEHFPDQALRTYVTDYCDTNKDNKLSAAECEAVQCIDLFEMKITKVADMTGIEHFTNLHELIACNNQIATLDLSGMAVTATMSDGTPPSSARANTRSASSTRRPPAKRPSR